MNPPESLHNSNSPIAPLWARFTVGIGALFTLVSVLSVPRLFMVDDAYFYLQIGNNLANHLGSTFDGTTFTNGYHPLWQGVVALIAGISGQESLLLWALLVQMLFAGFTLMGLWRLALQQQFSFPIFVPLLTLLTQYTDKGWLSEGPLTALLHVVVLTAWIRRQPLLTGLALGLLFLARLDTVFFVVAVILLSPPQHRARIGISTVLVVTPWLLWTVLTTGHLLPVSGMIKSTFPIPDLSNPLPKLGWTGLLTALGCVAALGLAHTRTSDQARILYALGLGGLAHGLYTAIFTGPLWSTFVPYYWITSTLATGFVLGELFQIYFRWLPSLSQKMRLQLIGTIVVLLSIGSTGRAVRTAIARPLDPSIELAVWAGHALPNATFIALDAPGRLAWFSRRPVIAMDGLTRSYGFSAELEAKGIDRWATEHGVTHILSYTQPFLLPWCAVSVDSTGTKVTFTAPESGHPVGSRHFSSPLKSLNDMVSTEEPNLASVYAW